MNDFVRMDREEQDREMAPIVQPIADRFMARALGLSDDYDE